MPPKRGTRRYTVECLRSGQPRPYADHVYEYILTVEHIPYVGLEGVFKPVDTNTEKVKSIAKLLCIHFKERKENPEWHETVLECIDEIDEGKYRIVCTRAYTG